MSDPKKIEKPEKPEKPVKEMETGTFFKFLPEELIPTVNLTHPRYEIKEAMIDSILAWGVVNTITIYRDGTKNLINTGHRRWLHVKELNRRLREKEGENYIPFRVPCRYQKGDEVRLLSIKILENHQRLEDDHLSVARDLQNILDREGSLSDCVRALGKSESTVRNLLKILDLDDHVQKAIQQGEVSYTTAIELIGSSREEQRESLKEFREQGGGIKKTDSKKEDSGKSPQEKEKPVLRGTRRPTKFQLRATICKIKERIEQMKTPCPINMTLKAGLEFAAGDLSVSELTEFIQGLTEEHPPQVSAPVESFDISVDTPTI